MSTMRGRRRRKKYTTSKGWQYNRPVWVYIVTDPECNVEVLRVYSNSEEDAMFGKDQKKSEKVFKDRCFQVLLYVAGVIMLNKVIVEVKRVYRKGLTKLSQREYVELGGNNA